MPLASGSVTALHPATFFWTLGVFIATLVLLNKIAWPMLMRKMEEREVRIADGLKKAEEAEARARELADRQEQILGEARTEAQRLLGEARAAAENTRNELLAAAQTEIAAERDRAKREIGLERAAAVEELKRATVELTLDASARLLQRELRDEDHRRLAEQVVEEVASRL